jgi:hypothetical protein
MEVPPECRVVVPAATCDERAGDNSTRAAVRNVVYRATAVGFLRTQDVHVLARPFFVPNGSPKHKSDFSQHDRRLTLCEIEPVPTGATTKAEGGIDDHCERSYLFATRR